MREIKRIPLELEVIDLIQAKFEDYRAKQDLLTMIFEIHKNDEGDEIVKSAPFKAYEKEFAKTKVAYETAMEEVSKKYVPEEYRTSQYSFEINFEDKEMIISEA